MRLSILDITLNHVPVRVSEGLDGEFRQTLGIEHVRNLPIPPPPFLRHLFTKGLLASPLSLLVLEIPPPVFDGGVDGTQLPKDVIEGIDFHRAPIHSVKSIVHRAEGGPGDHALDRSGSRHPLDR